MHFWRLGRIIRKVSGGGLALGAPAGTAHMFLGLEEIVQFTATYF